MCDLANLIGFSNKIMRRLTQQLLRTFFEQNNIHVIQWPAKSPDLNIIEHIWYYIKNKVERKEPKTLQELRNFIFDSWNEVTGEYITNLYNIFKL